MKVTTTIEYAEARKIVDTIIAKAQELQKAVVICVADANGELLALARMDGAPITSLRIAANKSWTAARTGKPTQEIGDTVRHPEQGHDIAYYGDRRFVGWGGGIPLRKNSEVIGAIGVSGLSSAEDVSLAELGAKVIA
jgi:glc operon protein GlcG